MILCVWCIFFLQKVYWRNNGMRDFDFTGGEVLYARQQLFRVLRCIPCPTGAMDYDTLFYFSSFKLISLTLGATPAAAYAGYLSNDTNLAHHDCESLSQ
jgi:hypothetical protein